MKKLMITLLAIFAFAVQVSAMSYEQARRQALFLTDKMAYELNLTDDQYEAAYEINFDYLLSIDHYDDLYGVYWRRRNIDLSYILYDWQYRAYCAANYFYRPLYYETGYWRFRIYARYPYRDYYYFGRPRFYDTYRGTHSWQMNSDRSWYSGRQFGGGRSYGMRDGFQRGDYGRGIHFGNAREDYREPNNNYYNRQRSGSYGGGGTSSYSYSGTSSRPSDTRSSGRSFGSAAGNDTWNDNGRRQSSTQSTMRRDADRNQGSTSGNFGGARYFNGSGANSSPTIPNNTFSPNRSTGTQPSTSGRSFGGGSSNSTPTAPSTRSSGSFGGGSGSSNQSTSSGGGHFGGRR